MLYNVVGVRFKKAGKIYYFDPGEYRLEEGDYVIVETARGGEYGKVVIPVRQMSGDDIVLPLKMIVRPASEEDRASVRENEEEAARTFDIATKKIDDHGLEMKLVDVEYTFDRNKIIFYFTADGRVDFRNL